MRLNTGRTPSARRFCVTAAAAVPVSLPSRPSEKPMALSRRQALGGDLRLGFDQPADLAQEPRVDLAGAMDVLVGETKPHGLRHFEQALGRGRAERGAHRVLVVALAESLDRDLVEAGEAVF